MGGKGGSEAVATTTAPVLTAGAAPAPVVPAGKLPNTDEVVVVRDSSQLISFGLFKSKDPFVQQLSTTPAGAAEPGTAPATVGGSTGTPVATLGSTPPAAPRRRRPPSSRPAWS